MTQRDSTRARCQADVVQQFVGADACCTTQIRGTALKHIYDMKCLFGFLQLKKTEQNF